MSRLARVTMSAVLVSLAVGVLPGRASAGPDTVLQVVAVRVNPGKLETYLQRVQQLNGVMARLQVPGSMRVWQATMAGDATGTVVVGLEYPSLAAMAESTSKAEADPEWRKLIAGLDEIRTIVSRSLYDEITP